MWHRTHFPASVAGPQLTFKSRGRPPPSLPTNALRVPNHVSLAFTTRPDTTRPDSSRPSTPFGKKAETRSHRTSHVRGGVPPPSTTNGRHSPRPGSRHDLLQKLEVGRPAPPPIFRRGSSCPSFEGTRSLPPRTGPTVAGTDCHPPPRIRWGDPASRSRATFASIDTAASWLAFVVGDGQASGSGFVHSRWRVFCEVKVESGDGTWDWIRGGPSEF